MREYADLIAEYIEKISFEILPIRVTEKCEQLLLDTLGVMILGSETQWSKILLTYFKEIGGKQQAKIINNKIMLPITNAAYLNGTMAHSFDYDDDLNACHIASCIIPAALAVGESINSSGKDLIEAISIGYDITTRIAETLDAHHLYTMGFHPTSVCGAFGAGATASKLMHLSHKQIINTMGIIGSLASGTTEWLSDGSMTKRFHGGKAAYDGVFAASLARLGYTGPKRIFEVSSGILKMFKAQRANQNLIDDFFLRYDILNSYIKLHACCTCNAPIIDALIAIRTENKIDINNIDNIIISIRETCLSLVGEPIEKKRKPKTILDAQMSAPYCAAIALLEGKGFPEQFGKDKIRNKQIINLMKKVEIISDSSLNVNKYPRPVPAKIKLIMHNEEVIEKQIDYQKGTYLNPLSKDEIENKFLVCVKSKMSEKNIRELISKVYDLKKIKDVGEIWENLPTG